MLWVLLGIGPAQAVDKVVSPDPASYQYFGAGAGAAGDVDADGFDDLLIGASGDDDNRGAAYFYRGSAGGLQIGSPTRLTATDGSPADYFGTRAIGLGDMNGDGFAEIGIGAHGHNSRRGAVYLFVGGPDGPGEAIRVSSDAGQVGDVFGFGLHGPGDVDGDGLYDLVVGGYMASVGASNTGAVHVFSGQADLNDLQETVLTASLPQAGAHLGQDVGTGGDLDGDGLDEVAAGASGAAWRGLHVIVWYGSPAGVDEGSEQIVVPEGIGDDHGFGPMVSIAGDLDGDGYDDLAGGAHYDGTRGVEAGAVYTFRGSSGGLDLESEVRLTASDGVSYDYFGNSVAIVRDVNGDGFDEVLVGAHRVEDTLGAAYLFHGSPVGATEDLQSRWVGADRSAYEYFGTVVGSAGDLDGDGLGEVFVGEHDHSLFYAGGALYLTYGVTDRDVDGVAAEQDCDDLDASVDDSLVVRHPDEDGDGFGAADTTVEVCDGTPGTFVDGDDCDDTSAVTFPGAAAAESDVACMRDVDGDGYGADEAPDGVDPGQDCDDGDPSVHPHAEEPRGDERDGDCDGEEYCYADQDGDGWSGGQAIRSLDLLCDAVGEAVIADLGDCDDTDPSVRPGATDTCGDGVDADCDGTGGPEDDEDGDGLTWSQEDRLATSDCDLDSDDDGLDDDVEYDGGTDPTNPDTDGDGLLDGEDPDPFTAAVAEPRCGCGPSVGAAWPSVFLLCLAVFARVRDRGAVVPAPTR